MLEYIWETQLSQNGVEYHDSNKYPIILFKFIPVIPSQERVRAKHSLGLEIIQ